MLYSFILATVSEPFLEILDYFLIILVGVDETICIIGTSS